MFILIASCVISLGIVVEVFRKKKKKNKYLREFFPRIRERFNFSKRSELRSGSVMELRVVEILVDNVILDMYELTAIGLSVIETLVGSS